MSNNLQEILKEALLNNTYDYNVMHDTLSKAWKSSYSYLYALQKSYIEYEELFYFSNDSESRNSKLIGKLYLDKYSNATFDIDYDLIHVCNREEFRTSEFYKNKFTIYDMIYHPEIFIKIPLIIIDDKVIWDYKIESNKDVTNITLPFKRNFVLKDERNSINDDIIYIDHKIQVLVIDNTFYGRIYTNRNNIEKNPEKRTISFNKSNIEKSITDDITARTLNEYLGKFKLLSIIYMNSSQKREYQTELNRRVKLCTDFPSSDGIMMCSFHYPNQVQRGYELGTSLLPMEYKDGKYTVTLPEPMYNEMNTFTRNFYVSFVFVNRLYKHTFYDDSDIIKITEEEPDGKLMVVQEAEMIPYKTPIPVENFMVFKKENEESPFILQKNVESLEMHYPNIYVINDMNKSVGNIYQIYYFYYNTYDFQYTVLFDFYFKFLLTKFEGMKIEQVLNDIYYNKADLTTYTEEQKNTFYDFFNKIMDYEYFVYNYGETDFIYRYKVLDQNFDKSPTEYKIETLKEWIRQDQWLLKDYANDQNKIDVSYHLFANTIDLPSRIRRDTTNELDKNTILFNEDRYVLAFNNERENSELLDCRVFVDGIFIDDVYQGRNKFLDYFYIPCDKVNPDSYIELEVFPKYEFTKEIVFDSMDSVKTIKIAEPKESIYPTVADVYFKYDNGNKRYLPDVVDMTSCYSEGEFLVETTDESKPVKFTRVNTFKIQPKKEEILNKELEFTITKKAFTVRSIIEKSGYPMIKFTREDFCFNSDYVRVFINGRLISRNRYRFIVYYGSPYLIFYDWHEQGDTIFIDVTPFRYTEIYYKKDITEDKLLIDLRGVINKPFDIRYYDMYINGRKMSLNNVMNITPWEITLVNLKSNYNLIIYEKDRDWEYFGLDYTNDIYYFTFDDILKKDILTDEEKKKMFIDMINDQKDKRLVIHPNTNDEDELDYSKPENTSKTIFQIYYTMDLIPKTFYNPDILQNDDYSIYTAFPDIYNEFKTTTAEHTDNDVLKERRKNYPNVLYLDPDSLFERQENVQETIVYGIGHFDEVDDSTLQTEIDIPSPEEGNIDKERKK